MVDMIFIIPSGTAQSPMTHMLVVYSSTITTCTCSVSLRSYFNMAIAIGTNFSVHVGLPKGSSQLEEHTLGTTEHETAGGKGA